MHILEKAFIDLLRNHLCISNDKIYAGNRYRPKDITPCVNLLLADETFIRRRYVEINNKQYIEEYYNAELWINIWCNKEEERAQLLSQIKTRINQLLANHYTTCIFYDCKNHNCSQIMDICEALTSQSNRANKNLCPNPTHYRSVFNMYHIPKRTFHVNSITDLDELEISESILRSIFKLEMDYYTYYEIGGRVFTDFTIEG